MIASRSTSKSKNQIADTIQELQSFIDQLGSEFDLITVKNELEVIKSSIKEDKKDCKPNLQIIGVDNDSSKGCFKLIKEDKLKSKKILEKYNLQSVFYPNQPTITNQDILCLVIDSEERLTNDAKHMIKYLSQSKLSKLIVLIDMPKNDDETTKEIESYIAESKSKIIQYNPSLEVAFLTINLSGYYPDVDKKNEMKAKRAAKPKVETLFREIENVPNLSNQENSSESTSQKVKEQIQRIETALSEKTKKIEHQKQQKEEVVNNPNFSYGEIKKEIDLTFKKIDKERDKFFKFCRERLNIWNSSLLDDYDIRGIKYKIKQEIDKITLVRRESWTKYLLGGGKATLIPENKDTLGIHKDIIYLYQDMLNENFNREWNNICTKYYCHGLNILQSNTYKTLDSSFGILVEPPKELKNNTEQKTISGFFNAKIKDNYEWEKKYVRLGFLSMLVKDLRSQAISISSLITLAVIPFLGNFIPKECSEQSNIKKLGNFPEWLTEKYSNISSEKLADKLTEECSKYTPKGMIGQILPYLLAFILITTIIYYCQKNHEKEESEIEKIKKDGYNYYQSLGKYYVNRVQSFINAQLNIEEQNIKELLEEYKEDLCEYIVNIEKEINEYKNKIKYLKDQTIKLYGIAKKL